MLIIPIQEWLGFQVELWINSYVVFIDVLGKLVCLEAAGEGPHQPSPRWARRGGLCTLIAGPGQQGRPAESRSVLVVSEYTRGTKLPLNKLWALVLREIMQSSCLFPQKFTCATALVYN